VLDLIDKAQGRIMALNQADEKDVVPVSSLLVDFYEELKRRRNSENKLLGLSTGINALDKILNGLQPGSLYVVAGRPSMGKSVVGFHFALQAALNGTAALMESLEMSQQDLLFRAVASMGRIPLGRLLNAELNVEEWGWVRDTLRTLHNSPLFIAEQSGLTVATLRRKARGLKKKKNLGLIVVDYLQLMRGDQRENRTREIGGMSNALKCLAKELHVPVVVLSQLNRGLESRDDKRPVQSDLRDSGEIEQDADVILAIYRDEVYNPETVDAGFMEIIVRKQRQGQLGTVPVRFEGDFVRISGLTSETGGLPSWNMPKEESPKRRNFGAQKHHLED
jgi:replicative DNA helicase